MKLRNKKTGEIGKILKQLSEDNQLEVITDNKLYVVKSLAKLNEEWEDYEEPKVYYYISDFGAIRECEIGKFPEDEEARKLIGNYFETEEEAEKAVEKLKAWKRLKDRNLRFNLSYTMDGATIHHKDVIMCRVEAYFDDKGEEDNTKAEEDLDLFFGGEE